VAYDYYIIIIVVITTSSSSNAASKRVVGDEPLRSPLYISRCPGLVRR